MNDSLCQLYFAWLYLAIVWMQIPLKERAGCIHVQFDICVKSKELGGCVRELSHNALKHSYEFGSDQSSNFGITPLTLEQKKKPSLHNNEKKNKNRLSDFSHT